MRIIIDADACPSIGEITALAKQNNIELLLYVDNTHNIENEYAKVIVLDKGFQSVDMAIINDIEKSDILVTQDFGLATLVLAKKVKVVHPKGMIYTDDNIDRLLFERHINNLNRKQNIHMKGPKKRNKEDVINLLNSLNNLIKIEKQ